MLIVSCISGERFLIIYNKENSKIRGQNHHLISTWKRKASTNLKYLSGVVISPESALSYQITLATLSDTTKLNEKNLSIFFSLKNKHEESVSQKNSGLHSNYHEAAMYTFHAISSTKSKAWSILQRYKNCSAITISSKMLTCEIKENLQYPSFPIPKKSNGWE